MEIYGQRITRCLVDRDFGMESHKKKTAEGRPKWWEDVMRGINVGSAWGVGNTFDGNDGDT